MEHETETYGVLNNGNKAWFEVATLPIVWDFSGGKPRSEPRPYNSFASPSARMLRPWRIDSAIDYY